MLWWPLDLYDTLRIAVGSPPEPPVRVPCGRPQPDEDKEEIFHRIKPGSSPEGVWGCHKLDTPWISGGRQPLDLAKDRPTHCPTRSGNGVGSLFLSGQASSLQRLLAVVGTRTPSESCTSLVSPILPDRCSHMQEHQRAQKEATLC